MKVLFLCKANVGRSQMAADLCNKLTASNDAESAGTQVDVPDETLAERRIRRGATYAIDAMLEEGVDISKNKRVQLTKEMLETPYIRLVNMAEPQFTPEWLASDPRYEYWEISDPESGNLQATVSAKESIKLKIRELIDEV